jgi:hypothetical protein
MLAAVFENEYPRGVDNLLLPDLRLFLCGADGPDSS